MHNNSIFGTPKQESRQFHGDFPVYYLFIHEVQMVVIEVEAALPLLRGNGQRRFLLIFFVHVA